MTEKEAIKELLNIQNIMTLKHHIAGPEAIRIVLNLIQTQQEEIKTQRDIIVRHIKKKIELEEKIEKKDKIIDEMAKTLKWALNVGLGFIPSSICTCKEDIRNCEDKICTDCIKQYFTKKIEKE